jgi:hypothetical protein
MSLAIITATGVPQHLLEEAFSEWEIEGNLERNRGKDN